MYRTDAAGNVNGMYDNGDPLIPREATFIDATHLNAIQEEIVGVVLASGATLNKADNTQLLKAIKVPPAWVPMTLLPPWSAVSHTPSCRLESNTRRVFLKGKLQATIATGADFDFWNVPAEYRPQHEILLPCAAASGGATDTGVLRLALGATPHLEFYSWGGVLPAGGSSYTLYLDGISWTID